MKYRTLLSVFLSLLLSVSSVLAEPASTKSIKLLMERTGAGDIGVQMMNNMITALKKMIPDAPEKFWEDVTKEIDSDQIIALIIPVYQKHLTEKDIQEINAFYNTDAGKKLIKSQPAIMQESMVLGQQWGQQIARDIINKYKAQAETIPQKPNSATQKPK